MAWITSAALDLLAQEAEGQVTGSDSASTFTDFAYVYAFDGTLAGKCADSGDAE